MESKILINQLKDIIKKNTSDNGSITREDLYKYLENKDTSKKIIDDCIKTLIMNGEIYELKINKFAWLD